MEVDIPAFNLDVYQSNNNLYFPFFDPAIEMYLKHFREPVLLARDTAIEKVNMIISKRRMVEKYQPIICSTSRGMGKTAFMEAVGMQLVKPNLKSKSIEDAVKYGRILSFDFASSAAEFAVPSQEDIRTFFTRLMIYFLCRMFDGTLVGGIHFQKILSFSEVVSTVRDPMFNEWKSKWLPADADNMMDEYIRLTNIAFGVTCSSPPVFLLDEIQGLCKETTVQSKFQGVKIVNHSFLSLLLTQLAGRHKPVCICTGTNSGNIITISEKSKIVPQFISLSSLHKKDDYEKFWNQRTDYMNVSLQLNAQKTDEDEEMFNSLVYATYQIPRLLLLAHNAWFNYKTTSNLKDLMAPLQSYEDDAITYYSEMSELLFNSEFEGNDIPHILMSCGVNWEVRDIYSHVPGTNHKWASLISMSVVFPYVDNCYIIPFSLLWAAKTPSYRSEGDYRQTRTEIMERCKLLIPNLDINNMFVSYDKLRKLNLYNLGMCYEYLFASSLAVKFYLLKLEQAKPVQFLQLYNVSDEDAGTKEALSNTWVDFSNGMMFPEQESFVDSSNLPNAIIHNFKTHTAHHDIILPAIIAKGVHEMVSVSIAVSCKASFDLSSKKTIEQQLMVSKTNDAKVDVLIWLYLGNQAREGNYAKNVVFMNGNGCCNGLALDMIILTKKLISLNNRN